MSLHGGYRPPANIGVPRSGKDQVQQGTILDMQAQIERQALLIEALSRILIAKGVVVEEELNEWMRYVDGLDGRVDGKLRPTKEPKNCPACNRINAFTATKCQYCGAEFSHQFLVGKEPEKGA